MWKTRVTQLIPGKLGRPKGHNPREAPQERHVQILSLLLTILLLATEANKRPPAPPLSCPIRHFDKQAVAVPDSACQEITHRATVADHSSPRAGNLWEGGGGGGGLEG